MSSPHLKLNLIKHYIQSCLPPLRMYIIAIVSTLPFNTHKNGIVDERLYNTFYKFNSILLIFILICICYFNGQNTPQ